MPSGEAKSVKEAMGENFELPEQEFECQRHGIYTVKPIRICGEILSPGCPDCEKILAEEEKAREEHIETQRAKEGEERRLGMLKKMNIGKKFWEESFKTFNPYTPDLKRYLDICIGFANDHEGRMLVMLGNNGNGKDHLAASILKKTGGYMYTVFEIELLLKECYSGKVRESALFKRLCNAPVLVINEIGKHKPGEWEANFLSHIINKRYENQMPTVLISNKHISCPKNGCTDCLQAYLGNDVLSRIVEDGEIMVFNEADYRHKKREMRGAK
jgi:DNA replication protein DnaC